MYMYTHVHVPIIHNITCTCTCVYMHMYTHVRTYELCFKAHVQSLEKVSMLVSMVTHYISIR